MNMDSTNNIAAGASDNTLQWRHVELTRNAHTHRDDATVCAEYEHIIQKAMNSEPEGLETMEAERMRTQLQSGLLDGPEAARIAARNILLFGI